MKHDLNAYYMKNKAAYSTWYLLKHLFRAWKVRLSQQRNFDAHNLLVLFMDHQIYHEEALMTKPF